MDEVITQKDSSQSNPNTDNFFKACETAIRQYRELMETLQVECVQSWKKILDSTQQDLIRNNEKEYSIPDYAQKIIHESMDNATRFVQFQNNISSQAFAMMIKNIKMMNEASNPVMKLSNNWVNFWRTQTSRKTLMI